MSVPTHPHRHASQKSKATRRKEREQKYSKRNLLKTEKQNQKPSIFARLFRFLRSFNDD